MYCKAGSAAMVALAQTERGCVLPEVQFVVLELNTLDAFKNSACFSVHPPYLSVSEVSTSS